MVIPYNSPIANCLQHTFDTTFHLLEGHIPDELSTFSALLYPLKRLSSCHFISAFEHNPEDSSDASNSFASSETNKHHWSARPFLAASASSHRALGQLRGLQVHASDLCNIWTDRITAHFQISHFEWFRGRFGARHEFLIFGIENTGAPGTYGKGLWLRVERRPTEELKRKRDTLTRLVGWHEAYDLVTVSHQKENLFYKDDAGAELVQTSAELGPGITLSYLINVLEIIHDESHAYHLAGANCWFYASTIAEIALCKAQGDWNWKPLRGFDHRKSKEWVNWTQYRLIMERVKQL